MTCAPICFGIYCYYDKSLDRTIAYKIPYINSFEFKKDMDNMTIKCIVKLPKNIAYFFNKKQNLKPADIIDLVEGGKPNSPFFYEIPNELTLSNGLMILDQENTLNLGKSKTGDTIKSLKWVSLDNLLNSSLGKSKASSGLKELRMQGLYVGFPIYYGKMFTFDEKFTFDKASKLTIDSLILDNLKDPTILKFTKNYGQDSISRQFAVGDLFILRHGFLSEAANPPQNRTQIVNIKDKLLTNTFYITKIVPTENDIELHLENWTWKLRQIPCRGTFPNDITLLDFLKSYVFPVILKETYINGIITRDAELATSKGDFGLSSLTNNLIKNTISKGFYLPITNFYDILLTLKEKFMLLFFNVEYFNDAILSCSMDYGYRDMTEAVVYDSRYQIIKKDITNLSYDDYKVLIRVTSNREIKGQELKDFKASIKKGTTKERYNILLAQKKKVGQVIFGDKGVLGMIRSNASRLGQQTLQSESNDGNCNIINIEKIWVKNENLEEYAKRMYNKIKFANQVNKVSIKGTSFTDLYGDLCDLITIIDRQDPSLSSVFIITSIGYSMDVNNGYTKDFSLGVKIPTNTQTNFIEKLTQ